MSKLNALIANPDAPVEVHCRNEKTGEIAILNFLDFTEVEKWYRPSVHRYLGGPTGSFKLTCLGFDAVDEIAAAADPFTARAARRKTAPAPPAAAEAPEARPPSKPAQKPEKPPKRRKIRGVRVGDTEFLSLTSAFAVLGLPFDGIDALTAALKAEGRAALAGHEFEAI